MKIEKSNSPALKKLLKARGSVTATMPFAEFQKGVIINFLLLVLLLAPAFPKKVAVVLFTIWNLWLVVRALASRRHWVLICTSREVCVRVLATEGKPPEEIGDVIVFENNDIKSLSVRSVEIIWPRTTPTIVEFLRVRSDQNACEKLLATILVACVGERDGLVQNIDESLYMQWKIYRPPLRTFLRRVSAIAANLKISGAESSTVDLRRFWELPEGEQRKLFARVKALGFGSAGVIMLTHYRKMSNQEAIGYIASLGVDDATDANIIHGL